MPKITEIKIREDKVTVEFDNQEKFILPPLVFSNYQLSSSQDISEDLYYDLKKQSDKFKAKQKGLDFLARKDRSVAEVKKYLKRINLSDSIIDETLDSFISLGYLNDYDFARKYASYWLRHKVIGELLLKKKLYEKGLQREIIEQVLKEEDVFQINLDEIYSLAQKKYRSLEGKVNKKAKLANFLRQRGFGSEVVFKMINRVTQEKEE